MEARDYGVEKERGPVPHLVPDRTNVGLQVGNPVGGHVVGMSVPEMVHVHIMELVHDHIVEQGTGIVDPETPVGHSTVQVLVTWDVGNPGVGPGSLTFPMAESWACQVNENVVSDALFTLTRIIRANYSCEYLFTLTRLDLAWEMLLCQL